MPIPNSNPLTVPARAEKSYPDLWIKSFRVVAKDNRSGSVVFETLPCDATTGEIAPDEVVIDGRRQSTVQRLSVPLWQLVAEVPEAAQAMGAVFAAYPAIKAWQDARIAAAKAEAEGEAGSAP